MTAIELKELLKEQIRYRTAVLSAKQRLYPNIPVYKTSCLNKLTGRTYEDFPRK